MENVYSETIYLATLEVFFNNICSKL